MKHAMTGYATATTYMMKSADHRTNAYVSTASLVVVPVPLSPPPTSIRCPPSSSNLRKCNSFIVPPCATHQLLPPHPQTPNRPCPNPSIFMLNREIPKSAKLHPKKPQGKLSLYPPPLSPHMLWNWDVRGEFECERGVRWQERRELTLRRRG
jgi:hypothetical protein